MLLREIRDALKQVSPGPPDTGRLQVSVHLASLTRGLPRRCDGGPSTASRAAGPLSAARPWLEMNPTDPRTQAALDAALGHIASTAASAAARAVRVARLAWRRRRTRIIERDAVARRAGRPAPPDGDLPRSFQRRAAREGACKSSRRATTRGASSAGTDLGVAQPGRRPRGRGADVLRPHRQTIPHECEWELRELDSVHGRAAADRARRPGAQPAAPRNHRRRAVPRHRSRARPSATRASCSRASSAGRWPRAMRLCYAEIVSDLKARGVQAACT